jgi:cyclohexyl-isocyanide hydratase
MRIAFVLYDRVNLLDFAGTYDALMRLKTLGFIEELSCNTCALKEEIRDNHGLLITPSNPQESLDGYDMVLVPGGIGTRTLSQDEIFLAWLRSSRSSPIKVGICTGSLLLAAAGFLKGKTATTHPEALDLLASYGVQTRNNERVIDEGDILTCKGVSASIDMGIYLCKRLCGEEAAMRVAASMDYPFFAGL